MVFLARHSSRTNHRSRILSLLSILWIYEVVYISIKDLHAGYAATRWRNLLSNSLRTKLHYAIKES